jgi:uncharacterized protein YggE
MNPEQAIRQPFGVTTYGSAVIRVDPDIASIHFAISKTESHPKESFRVVRETSKKVADYLQRAAFKKETNSSRISLSQDWEHYGGTSKFIGYTARAGFHTILFNLDQLENLLVGLVDSGVNEISNVNFQTRRLKELREEARRKSVEAAVAKAENYCLAARVKLGGVVHIEDGNPDTAGLLSRGYMGHAMNQNIMNTMLETEDTEELQAFNPGGISISAAVLMSFHIANE